MKNKPYLQTDNFTNTSKYQILNSLNKNNRKKVLYTEKLMMQRKRKACCMIKIFNVAIKIKQRTQKQVSEVEESFSIWQTNCIMKG